MPGLRCCRLAVPGLDAEAPGRAVPQRQDSAAPAALPPPPASPCRPWRKRKGPGPGHAACPGPSPAAPGGSTRGQRPPRGPLPSRPVPSSSPPGRGALTGRRNSRCSCASSSRNRPAGTRRAAAISGRRPPPRPACAAGRAWPARPGKGGKRLGAAPRPPARARRWWWWCLWCLWLCPVPACRSCPAR